MKAALIGQSILILFLAGCASTSAKTSPAEPMGGGDSPREMPTDDSGRKLDELQRKLQVAEARLEVARMELDSYTVEQEARVRHAEAELALAKAHLDRFREAEVPHRLASEELDLRSAKDRAQEAADELAQIEIMYKDQDLDDLTAEFVVSRGRRNAERAAARIKIMEDALAALQSRELPEEDDRLQLAVDKAMVALEKTEREGDIGRRNKEIAVKEAENSLAKIEGELAELKSS